MGQQFAKREVEDGLKLYNLQNHEAAVKKWQKAVNKMTSKAEKFLTLGYLAAAHCDWGKYRDMLAYAIQQIDIANDSENNQFRSEAYLNLARSNQFLGEYHKAVSYCRHSLQYQPKDMRVHGYVFMCLANAYHGFSNYHKALENYHNAMKIAKQCEEHALELQIYTGLGTLYTTLRDYEKGLSYHMKAAELAKSFDVCDLSSKYQRLTCLNLATPYRKLGRYNEAMECCEDALKMALAQGDRPVQAKCLCCFADIHRKRNDYGRAYPRYESALNIMAEIGDRHGQVEVLAGMAKTLVIMKQFTKALELNAKALDLSRSIGNKMQMLQCHMRMEELYRSLGDFEMVNEQLDMCRHLVEEMELLCGICSMPMGDTPEKIETLPCFHIFHARCAMEIGKGTLNRTSSTKTRGCPHCRKTASGAPVYV